MSGTFGERLRRARKSKRWSQKTLGERVNADDSTVTKWENDTFSPDPDRIARLAEVLGVSGDYLLGLTHDRSPSRRREAGVAALDSLDSRELLAVAFLRSAVRALSDTLAQVDPEGIGIEIDRDKPGEVLTEILRLANLVSPSGDEDKQG